jgi:hypothetical protein
VVRLLAERNAIGALRYELRCDCGRMLIRSSGAINRAIRDDRFLGCRRCEEAKRRLEWETKQAYRKERWLEQWRSTGSLYTDHSDERFRDLLRESIAESLGIRMFEESALPPSASDICVFRDCCGLPRMSKAMDCPAGLSAWPLGPKPGEHLSGDVTASVLSVDARGAEIRVDGRSSVRVAKQDWIRWCNERNLVPV